ncbi:MAG: DNA recombination protein RmuC [Desulfovibrio sp.]|nr:DNA recombination protein RmuC [Desulfovibrio sp.]
MIASLLAHPAATALFSALLCLALAGIGMLFLHRRHLEQRETLSEALRVAQTEATLARAESGRIPALEAELVRLREEKSELAAQRAELTARMDEAHKAVEEKVALLSDLQTNLSDTFKALSNETLQSNNAAFLQLAHESFAKLQESSRSDLDLRRQSIQQLVSPLNEHLAKVRERLSQLEKERTSAYSSLTEQVRSMALTQAQLKDETGRLVHALTKPLVRGRWGEIQLRRVVELAGMLPHCDFYEQQQTGSDHGNLRPDMLIRLPGGKNIVVDAKAPLEAYLAAIETSEETPRNQQLDRHARHIRQHLRHLGAKSYWAQFSPTPEFVIMFLPGEMFFSSALHRDPALIEEGVNNGVIIASPTTLIALLRSVAYGWQQETIARSAQEVNELGRELYDRLRVFAQHMGKVGRSLGTSVQAYNQAVGSLETRVLSSARRFRELGAAGGKEIPELGPQETMARRLQAPELCAGQPEVESLEGREEDPD